MSSKRFRPSVLFIVLFSAALGLTASDFSSLRGTVTDASGAPVSQAVISAHAIAGSALVTAVTDANGRFRFNEIAAGEYLLDASARGLSLQAPPRLRLFPGERRQISLRLVVSTVKTEVSVTAAALPQSVDQISKQLDIVNTADSERRGIISVSDAVRFVPGLRVSTRGGPGAFTTIQTRGLRVTDTAILIDGFPFRDPTSVQNEASAYIGDLLLVDSSHIEILQGSGSSLYGSNAMSGTVNIITDPGGGLFHADLDLQGGGLGMFRGLARVSGGAFANKLSYSAGLSRLDVTRGVDDAGAARDWGAQVALSYALRPNMRIAADLFGNIGFLQENVSPMPTATAPLSGVIPAIPLTGAQRLRADANLPYDPGAATFVPSLGDPDAGRHSHFVASLLRFEHEVTPRLSYRLAYGALDTVRSNTDGPGGPGVFQPVFNTSDRYAGHIDTLQARMNYLLGSQVLTAGYEFQREHYLNISTDQNPNLPLRAYYSTDARQRTNAIFAQDEMHLLHSRLAVLLSGRFTQANLDQPRFVNGGPSPYAGSRLPLPPAAYTGDASVSYFVASASTKLRAHAGNSFRLPSLYERFGGFLFNGFDFAYGDPRLAPERAISVDFGFDKYAFRQRLKFSGTYFYSHLQQVIEFLDFPPGYIDPYGRSAGYRNTSGGIARGVELSAEMRPSGRTSVLGSYTYTNAQDRTSQYFTGTPVAPLQSPRILPNSFTLVATQQLGPVDLALDLQAGSSYLYPLYGYAYRFSGPRQVGLSAGYSFHPSERITTRLYLRVWNALGQDYYEDGFRTPPRWAVAGVRFTL